ncbi:hypothetical protein OLP40_02035 [Campylobacter jejuni]|nr:hypothetical protein C414_000010130 [Campylobacter jejuni subsp. jejuni 414]MCW1333168.1 hypothetical protein [Campylobacter jejuni]MCW1358609.1 hypothetical protein [Campylobacter jejuni]HDZ4931465.1 hypothetical protein [Campylobacter jejuni]HDZ4937644.1 hypothetical protein [Campylobacter jejuni]
MKKYFSLFIFLLLLNPNQASEITLKLKLYEKTMADMIRKIRNVSRKVKIYYLATNNIKF